MLNQFVRLEEYHVEIFPAESTEYNAENSEWENVYDLLNEATTTQEERIACEAFIEYHSIRKPAFGAKDYARALNDAYLILDEIQSLTGLTLKS